MLILRPLYQLITTTLERPDVSPGAGVDRKGRDALSVYPSDNTPHIIAFQWLAYRYRPVPSMTSHVAEHGSDPFNKLPISKSLAVLG
jgi:hypothetical protein